MKMALKLRIKQLSQWRDPGKDLPGRPPVSNDYVVACWGGVLACEQYVNVLVSTVCWLKAAAAKQSAVTHDNGANTWCNRNE